MSAPPPDDGRRARLPVLALVVLVGLVGLYAFVLGVSTAWTAGRLATAGTTSAGAVLRAVAGPDGPALRVYVLVGTQGHVVLVDAPEPLPPHGSRLEVTYLADDPEGTAVRADQTRAELVRGLLLVLVGAAGTAAAVVLAVRLLTPGRPDGGRPGGGGGSGP